MKHRVDPDGQRLPIKLDTTSNGEFVPVPLSATNRAANHMAQEAATANAKRLGLKRRDFLLSACGAASTLLAFNAANAAAGRVVASTICTPMLRWTRSSLRPRSKKRSSSSTYKGTSSIPTASGWKPHRPPRSSSPPRPSAT